MKKILTLSLAVLMLASLLCSCNLSGTTDKTFSKAGMSITLTSDFAEKELASQTAYYESQKAIVTVLKEEFSLFIQAGISTDISVKEYANLCIQGNNLSDTKEITNTDAMYGFTYAKTVSGKDFTYYAYCFRSTDSYWLIQFACETKNTDEFDKAFEKYAESVTFDSETTN